MLIARISKSGTKAREPVLLCRLPVLVVGMVPMMMMGVVLMAMMSSCLCTRCERKKQCTRGNDSTHTVFLHTVEGKGSPCDPGRVNRKRSLRCDLNERAELIRLSGFKKPDVA
jgi:hypothetical protein